MHKFSSLTLAAALLGLSAGAHAAPNLLLNGSFENGLAAWSHGGTTASNPAVAISYGVAAAYPTAAYGESVPVPNDTSASPDGPGTHGAYFVDDHSVNESLMQSVFLAAGNYQIGFDAYAPANGYANPVDATFSGQIAGVMLANYAVSTRPSTTWLSFSSLVTVARSGFYDASFVFNTPGAGAAKDIVVDRAYIIASAVSGGPVVGVPEPAPMALFGIAMGAMVVAKRRRTPTVA